MTDNPLTINGTTLVRCEKNAWGDIKIPDGVKCIENSAFSDCENIDSVEIPDSVAKIESWAFRGCKKLMSVRLPQNNSLEMGDAIFLNCEELAEIEIPNGVEVVTYGMFQGCKWLERVSIPDSVTEIDHFAFKDCFRAALYDST